MRRVRTLKNPPSKMKSQKDCREKIPRSAGLETLVSWRPTSLDKTTANEIQIQIERDLDRFKESSLKVINNIFDIIALKHSCQSPLEDAGG